MFFCPYCSNCLKVEIVSDKSSRFFCQTCSYICPVKNKISEEIKIENKKVVNYYFINQDVIISSEDFQKYSETVESIFILLLTNFSKMVNFNLK